MLPSSQGTCYDTHISQLAVVDQVYPNNYTATLTDKHIKLRAGGTLALTRVTYKDLSFLIATGDIIYYVLHNEQGIIEFAYSVYKARCASPNGPGFMVDAGANFGFYGLMAIAAGCRVTFLDPQ
jgi:hypothetical protein